jgi:spore maturation protein CgeB
MASITKRVLVCSSFPDHLNTNAYLRDFVAEGFRQAFPEATVVTCSLEASVGCTANLRPTLVLVMGSVMLDHCDYTRLREAATRSNARLVFWLHDDPYEFDANYRIYPLADFIFTNDRTSLSHYPPDVPVAHLPLAASALHHYRPVISRSLPDWFFCGYIYPNRREFLGRLVEQTSGGMIIGPGWLPPVPPPCSPIRIANHQLPDYYTAALSVISIGRNHDLANARFQIRPSTPGPRTFEAALAGAAQIHVTDSLAICEYFEPGREILLVDTPEEAAEQVARLRREHGCSERIGLAAQRVVAARHTYACRAAELASILEE